MAQRRRPLDSGKSLRGKLKMTIAEQIESDLAQMIRGGGDLPTKLTLTALSKYYHVSMTPVRQATDQLVQKNILVRGTNNRLSVNRKKTIHRESRTASQKPAVVKQDITSEIASQALRLSLRGEATFLREQAWAERFEISRTKIRQLFGKLAGAGILHHVPRCGWRVTPFRHEDMDAYLDVREMLELKALDLARHQLCENELLAMLEGNQANGTKKPRIDNRLHGYFVERSGNRYIQDFFATHGQYYSALFDYATLGTRFVTQMAEQHRVILQHVLDRRWPRARRALAEHIRAQKPVIEKMIAALPVGQSLRD